MAQEVIKEIRICNNIKCQKEYEATIHNVLGAKIVRGAGYCPKCAQEIYDAEVAREEAAKQAELARKRRQWRDEVGIPLRFMNEDFGTFERKYQPKAYDKCLTYAKGFPVEYRKYLEKNGKAYPSLVLMSPECWGVGKTHLACSIAHHTLNKAKDIGMMPVQFISEPELYRKIQATYSYTPEEKKWLPSEQDIILEMIFRDLLVLDDVGKERRTDPRFVQRILFAVFDGRYNRRLPIVLTTNLSAQELRQYLGGERNEACLDRLLEMCEGTFFQMKGESYRRKA